MPSIRVDLEHPHEGFIQGRNGLYDLTALEMWYYGEYDEPKVWIEGLGKRNTAIRGGFGGIPAKKVDELALSWLRIRGLLTQGEDVECDRCGSDMVSTVNMCGECGHDWQ